MNTEVKRPVIILGAGGHAKVVADVLKLSGYKVIGLITPDELEGSICFRIKVLGNDDVLDSYSVKEIFLANGIGSLPRKNLRWNLAMKFKDKGFEFVQIIHPSAIISSNVKLGKGIQIMAGSVIQAGTCIGDDTIINTGTNVDHDCIISRNCHLSPAVTLSGGVKIYEGAYIGTGTVVIQNISIGSNSIIAAGSVIHKNIAESTTFIQRKTNINQ